MNIVEDENRIESHEKYFEETKEFTRVGLGKKRRNSIINQKALTNASLRFIINTIWRQTNAKRERERGRAPQKKYRPKYFHIYLVK